MSSGIDQQQEQQSAPIEEGTDKQNAAGLSPTHTYSLRPPIPKKRYPDNLYQPPIKGRGRTGSAASSIDSAAATIGSAEQEQVGNTGGRRRARSGSVNMIPGSTGAADATERSSKRRRRPADSINPSTGIDVPIADVYWGGGMALFSPSCEKWRIVTKDIFDKYFRQSLTWLEWYQLNSCCTEPDDAEKYKTPEEQYDRERALKDLAIPTKKPESPHEDGPDNEKNETVVEHPVEEPSVDSVEHPLIADDNKNVEE